MDRKLTKSHSNFEIKQPNCTILFIFVCQLSFIDCILSKIVGFDQLWTAVQLVFFKMPNTFCRFTVQNCCYFLPRMRLCSPPVTSLQSASCPLSTVIRTCSRTPLALLFWHLSLFAQCPFLTGPQTSTTLVLHLVLIDHPFDSKVQYSIELKLVFHLRWHTEP